MSKLRPEMGTRSSSTGNTRQQQATNTGNTGKRGQSSSRKQEKSAYVDIIDQLDLSGMGMSVHHSGPFDAARSKSRPNQPAPIAAFSKHALDPAAAAVSSNGADLAPLRDSYVPYQNGGGNGRGLSERARAALSASNGSSSSYGYNDFDASSDNLLGSSPNGGTGGRHRRDSDSSITLGHPGQYGSARTEKERQYLEAFGVHNEAYEDYGNSRYARKPPRASVYPPSAATSKASLASTEKEAYSSLQPKSRSELRGDRTASIWDIEATLRAGMPVGAAAPPPPMPVMPDQYASASSSTSSSPIAGTSSVKRSKSLISRMRSKKTPISSPQQQPPTPDGIYDGKEDYSFMSSPGQAPQAPTLSYNDSYNRSPNGRDSPGAAPSPGVNEKNGYFERNDEQSPAMYPRRTTSNTQQHQYTSPTNSKLSPINGRAALQPSSAHKLQTIETSNLSPPSALPRSGGYSPNSNSNGRTPSPREKPPVSPLGLPEAGDSSEYFPRSTKYKDLASESATAAFLAESSSKESGISTTSSSSDGGGVQANRTGDSSFASSSTAAGNRSNGYGSRGASEERDENLDTSTSSSSSKGVSRKPSLVGRLLRGGKKKTPTPA